MEVQEIETLYKVFSKYKLLNPVTGHYCEVCLSEDDNHYFQTTPLRLISPARLSIYFSSVGVLNGNQNDFKYLVPRIFELIFLDKNDESFFFPSVWNILEDAKYPSWQPEEVEVINSLFKVYVEKCKEKYDNDTFILTRDILKDIGYSISE